MPISTTIDHIRGNVVLTGSGTIQQQDLIAALIETPKSYALAHDLRVLCDLQQATLRSLTTDDIEQIVAWTRHRCTVGVAIKTAMVVTQEVDFGIARMIAAQAETQSIEIRVYRDMASAQHWLASLS